VAAGGAHAPLPRGRHRGPAAGRDIRGGGGGRW
jgi:hypothetical protein